MVFLAECTLRSQLLSKTWFTSRLGWLKRPIRLFVYANRMGGDIVVSMTILLALLPLAILHAVNELCCPGCIIHYLLLFRDPGHSKRLETTVFDLQYERIPLASPTGRSPAGSYNAPFFQGRVTGP